MTDIKYIQNTAEYLANKCLENSEKYHGYTDRDLNNAVLIFAHFLMDATYKENQHLPQEKQLELADTVGKAIRELVRMSCGKDTHEIVNAK